MLYTCLPEAIFRRDAGLQATLATSLRPVILKAASTSSQSQAVQPVQISSGSCTVTHCVHQGTILGASDVGKGG